MSSASKPKWLPVPLPHTFTSLKEGLEAAKGLEGGRWRQYVKAPGDGKKIATLQCNDHVDCKRLVKVKAMDGGLCFELFMTGEHGEEKKEKRRANSTLTFDVEDALKFHMDTGGRPGSLLVGLTKERSKAIRMQGGSDLDFKSGEKGGLAGVMAIDTR